MTALDSRGSSLGLEQGHGPAELTVVEGGTPSDVCSPDHELEVVGDAASSSVKPLRAGVPLEPTGAPLDVARSNRVITRLARLLVVGADVSTVAAAMAAAYAILPPLYVDAAGTGGEPYRRLGMVALPLWVLVFRRYRLYHARHVSGRRDEVARIVHASGVSVLVTALVAYFLDLPVERGWFLMLYALAIAALMLEREVVRYGFTLLRRKGYCLRRVAIAGTGAEALAMTKTFAQRPELGYSVVGLVGDPDRMAPGLAELSPVLDVKGDLVAELRAAGACGVVVATTEVDLETSNRLIRTLTDAGIHVELSSSLQDIDATRLSVRALGCFPVLYVEPVKRDGWRPVAKRGFDIVVSTVILLATLPVLALAALAIKLTSAGPVLFRQERVGYRGRTFWIFKLRSMYVDANEILQAITDEVPEGPVPKIRRDPRVTPVGRLLRRLSIDELPQLLNVLRGDMSLVGPRPEQPSEVALWTPDLFERLRVRPGLTGVWQVNGRSAARDTKDRWDLYYVDNWSMWRDLAILLQTLPAVVSSKGAY